MNPIEEMFFVLFGPSFILICQITLTGTFLLTKVSVNFTSISCQLRRLMQTNSTGETIAPWKNFERKAVILHELKRQLKNG